MPFANQPIGGTTLVRRSIKSPNFLTGVSGWTVRKDGSAEFNNVVIRNGQVVSGTELFYSGTPAFGNLVASISATSGTDSSGNAYLAGITNYTSGTPNVAVNVTLATVVYLTSTTFAGPWTVRGQMSLNTITNGINLSTGNGPIYLTPGGANLVQSGGIQILTRFGFSGNAAVTTTDQQSFTVTAAANTQASNAWNIPANDANAGTVYRLTVWGFGGAGTTAQNLTAGIALNGAMLRSIALGATTANQSLRFRAEIDLHVVSTGAGGTADVNGMAVLNTIATPVVTVSGVFGSLAAGGESFNTTNSNTIQLDLAWGSTTGSPTLTTFGSTFERIGP